MSALLCVPQYWEWVMKDLHIYILNCKCFYLLIGLYSNTLNKCIQRKGFTVRTVVWSSTIFVPLFYLNFLMFLHERFMFIVFFLYDSILTWDWHWLQNFVPQNLSWLIVHQILLWIGYKHLLETFHLFNNNLTTGKRKIISTINKGIIKKK